MTNEEAKNLLKGMKDNNDRLIKQTQDVERIAAFELLNSALTIAIEAIEFNGVELLGDAVERVLDNYLSEQLAETIKKEITLELARSFDAKLS